MSKYYSVLILLVIVSCSVPGLNDNNSFRQYIYQINYADTSLIEQNIYYQNRIIEHTKYINGQLLVKDTLIYNKNDQLIIKTRYTDSCNWYATTEYFYENKKLSYKETNTSKRKVINVYTYNQNGKIISDRNTIYDKLNRDDIIYMTLQAYKYEGNEVLEYKYGQHDNLVSRVIKSYNNGEVVKERYYNEYGIKMYYVIYTMGDGLLLESSKFDGNGNVIENEKYTYLNDKLIKKLSTKMRTQSKYIYHYEYY